MTSRLVRGIQPRRRSGSTSGRTLPAALLVLALAAAASHLLAGDPRSVNGLGQPMAWDATGPVVYNPDPGPLGLLSNTQARALLAEAFAEWQAGPAFINFTEGTPLALDVNASGFAFNNPAHFKNFYRVNGDGKSPVIFDNDGSIIEALFGIGARFEILGVAAIDTPIAVDTEITGASIIINGAFYDGIGPPESPEDVTLLGLKAAMVHEIGHFINLDHTVLNHEQALDDNPGNDVYVPTMFPLAVLDEEALADTNPDDELAALNLYPPGFVPENPQRFGGDITAGGVPFQGANVVLRRTDDPLMFAFSLISGGRFFPCNPGSTCDPCNTACDPGNPPQQGSYFAEWFDPGQYQVCVEQIDTRFSAANQTFVGPLATPPIIPGPEECHDAAEGGTASDDPDDAIEIIPVPIPNYDIALNALPSSDPFEPNNTLLTGSALDDLAGGRDTAPAVMGSGDLDVFEVPVTTGQRVRIDIDARELGSTLDAVVGFYDAGNNLVALSDDAVDPDSQGFSVDPALDLVATFDGTAKVVVSSFPDLDLNGSGGGTTGGYWLRVQVTSDIDGDGTTDDQDICPSDPRDDADRDGECFDSDNCHSVNNPDQYLITKINDTLVSGGDVMSSFPIYFRISSDGTRVVYSADQDTDELLELYSVPIDGGGSTKLSGSMQPLGGLQWFEVSPDSSTIVFQADRETNNLMEIYSVPIGGGAVTKLNGTLAAGGNIQDASVVISPDGSRVTYLADQDTDETVELYSVPIGGGPVTKLNGTLAPGQDVAFNALFTSDGATVVYRTSGASAGLYSVPATGGASTLLNSTMISGVVPFAISSDDSWVVYQLNTEAVYSVPIGGGSETLLSGSLTPGGRIIQMGLSRDGSRVIYLAQDAVAVKELYSAPIGGGAVTKLNGALPAGGDVSDFNTQNQDNSVIYLADQIVDGVDELFRVPAGGGASTRLSGPLVAGGDVSPAWTTTQDRIAFIADKETDEFYELYSVPLAGGAPPVKLNAPMVAGETFGRIHDVSTDGSIVSYSTYRSIGNIFDLYSVPITGGGATKLNGPPQPNDGEGGQAHFTPDGSRMVYIGEQDDFGPNELYSVDSRTGADDDGDGVLNGCDLCPAVADTAQTDVDGNRLGDACQTCALGTDPDADGVCGGADNCPTIANAGQADFDADGAGDACDVDDDNDGLLDTVETDTGTFVNAGNTGTDPLDADTDDDGAGDGDEVNAGSNPVSSAAQPSRVPFGPQRTITTAADGAYGVFAADLDGDGDLDALSASSEDDKIAWYENTDGKGTFGTQQVITTLADRAVGVHAADLDGDGDQDVLSASNGDDSIAWYQNTDGNGTFGSRQVITALVDGARSVVAADIDRDGRVDVLYCGTTAWEVGWLRNLGGGTFSARQVIDASAAGAVTVFAADMDGDGDVDALSATQYDGSFSWYENTDGEGTFGPRQAIDEAVGASWVVSAADIDGDGDMDAIGTSWPVNGVLNWYENDGTPGGLGDWTVHNVTMPADGLGATMLATPDLDADGDPDIVLVRYTRVVWFENLGDGSFAPQRIVSPMGNYDGDGVFAADFDGDGDPDLLTAESNTLAGQSKVAWCENRMIHRNAAFTSGGTVTSSAANSNYLIVADVNGDGNNDVLSSSFSDDRVAWYQSDGSPSPTWTMRNISTAADGVEYIAVADVNGDGDLDVLSASFSDDTVAWYENNGAAIPGWTERDITTSFDGASSVTAADLDRDGDIDVIAASTPTEPIPGSSLVWYESDGAATPGWTLHDITATTSYQHGLATADFDRDGDLDFMSILASSYLAWYENNGASPPVFTEHVIPTNGAANNSRLVAADVDGDGDMDAVSAYYSTASMVLWLENLGGAPLGWTQHDIPSAGRNNPIDAGDIDADGDVDFLSASHTVPQVEWWENDGAADPSFTSHVVALSTPNPAAVAIGDVNGDGAKDLFARTGLNTIGFWLNQGGQYTLETTMTAPGSVDDGSTVPLLSIELTSNGRPADSEVELGSLEMLLTRSSGVTLTSDEANALIARLIVYRDEGAPGFQQGTDLPVATVDTLALSPLKIDFEAGDPRVRVAGGDSATYLVVAEMALDASTKSPNSFRIVHVPQSAFVRDAVSGVGLRMRSATSVTSPTITVGGDVTLPYVTSVYPPDGTTDASLMTNVVVFFSEPVTSTSAVEGVALYSGGLKVPALVRVNDLAVTIDPESSLGLNADYVVQVTSAVRDRDGNPVVPLSANFDTTGEATAGTIEAAAIADSGGGAALVGPNADDASGFAAAAVGDVNATAATGGIADLIIGAPNADAGAVDAGKVTLVFGSPALQGDAESAQSVTYRTATAGDFVGETVAQAGDVNHDGIQDFLIGAPRSDQAGADAGVDYLVFGNTGLDELSGVTLDLDNLASCSAPALCGVKLTGAAAGDLAGAALSWAGDVNGDRIDDIVVGAPGASPGGRLHAGSVYLIYGPLAAGTIDLGDVGSSVPGLVFNGEAAGDNAGAAVSQWRDQTGDGLDDLLIGAPGADALNAFGALIGDAGYVYAIQGGLLPGHLDDTATPGVIELSRVASGDSDQVAGMVFLGDTAGGSIGRSLTGAVDVDGDGVMDILVAGDGVAFLIPGDGPKTITGATPTPGTGGGGSLRAGLFSAVDDFHAIMFLTGDDDPLTIGPAGDLNNDGYDDFIIGAPLADGPAGTDAGRAYVVLGSPALSSEVIDLDDVGDVIAGFTVEGAAPGDNLGAAVGGGYDLNGDGIDDAIAGAPFADTDPVTPVDAGETYVISPLNPEEVVSLMLYPMGGGSARLEWSVPDQGATYNVYRGLRSGLVTAGQVKTSNMTQLACGISTDADSDLLPDYDDSGPAPPPGDAWFYLVTASNFQGEGPLGPTGALPQRVNDLQCP